MRILTIDLLPSLRLPFRFLPACLLCALSACLPASPATSTTFAFELSGSGTGSGLTFQDSGNGTCTPFGNVGFSTSGTLTPTSQSTGTAAGSFTMTLSNGDTITGAYSAVSVVVTSTGSQSTGTASITGGTGEFQNASGSLAVVFIAVSLGNHKSTFTATGSGTVSTANPPHAHYIIAHFPYGAGWSTLALVANNGSSDAIVTISFFSQSGAAASVPLAGVGPQTSQQIVVHPKSTQSIGADPGQRNSLASTQVAWATVSSTQPVNIFSLFDYGPNPPAITGSVGAPSMAPSTSFHFPVSVGGPVSYNAGMALANPNGSQTSVTVKVYNADGTLNNTFPADLAANAQTIFVLTQKMAFPAGLFVGSVAVCATQPVGLVALGVEGGPTGLFTTSVTTDPCT